MPALRFKTFHLLSGNVWNIELTIIQRCIVQRLSNKKRSIKRKIYSRENINSYIQSQTTKKFSLFYGDLPIIEMHRARERTSYIPFLLNPHRRVCVNNGMVNIIHFKLSHGDIIAFQENDTRTRGEEIKRSFYIKILVEKIIGKFPEHPWRRTKTKWFCLLKTKRGCRLLLKSRFLRQQKNKEVWIRKVFLGSSFGEHNRMKRNLYHFKSLFLSKRKNEKNQNIPTRIRSPIVENSSLYSNSTYRFPIKLPTHYSEVNHRTPKVVVCYGPNIGYIPHDIRLKYPNLLLWS
ncbi:unnamed protein product [Withania somnifera]